MYNDYYLQQIDNKLGALQTITTNQATIISNQEEIQETLNNILHINACIVMAIVLYLIEQFVERCLKC